MRFLPERYPNQPLKKVEPNRRAKRLCAYEIVAKSQTVMRRAKMSKYNNILYLFVYYYYKYKAICIPFSSKPDLIYTRWISSLQSNITL